MLNSLSCVKLCVIFIFMLCTIAEAVTPSGIAPESKSLNTEGKMHVVLAMPFRPNMPFDPHWYTPEYVNYIADLIPAQDYTVTGYFVSLDNIPKFLDDMEAMYAQNNNMCVLNVCDGGEWDGYPGISVLTEWEKHPIHTKVKISGSDSQFIYNSDDKTKMNEFIQKAGLKSLPQTMISAQLIDNADLKALLAKAKLDQSWPLFCKLNIGAGALGIGPESICHNIEQLTAQLHKLHIDFPKSDILVQPYLIGPEYTVFVLKDRAYVGVRRDFLNPYNLMLEDYLTGVRPPEEEIAYFPTPLAVQDLAVRAVQAIPGKPHYTRVDLRSDSKGNIYVIDINDRPGFGTPSTVKCMLDYHHMSEAQLLLDILKTCSKI